MGGDKTEHRTQRILWKDSGAWTWTQPGSGRGCTGWHGRTQGSPGIFTASLGHREQQQGVSTALMLTKGLQQRDGDPAGRGHCSPKGNHGPGYIPGTPRGQPDSSHAALHTSARCWDMLKIAATGVAGNGGSGPGGDMATGCGQPASHLPRHPPLVPDPMCATSMVPESSTRY